MQSDNRASDEAQIRALIEDRAAALRVKDADAVVAHHAAGFVHFSLAPPLVSDSAGKAGLQAWFDTWDGPLGFETRDMTIVAGEDTAFCHGLARLSGRQGGEEGGLWFRLTLGLRKIGGAWKITHEHESVPFYMDGSDKASVDLAP